MKTMENLQRDEELVTQGQVHWIVLVPHILLIFCFGIGLLTIWSPLIAFFTTELVLTSKRVYGKRGLINTHEMDIPLNKVNTISISSGLFGKILGYGRIHITASSGSYDYDYVRSPGAFRDAVLAQIDRFDEDRVRRQATELASAIKR